MARILVIDDEPSVRRAIRKMLELGQHEVLEAADGAQGLAAFRRDGADLVICDLLMPVHEGVETIQALKSEDPRAKVLAISGGGMLDVADRLADAELLGADGSLMKPFEMEELFEAVDALLARP